MKPAKGSASEESECLILPMREPDHLFNGPAVNPLSAGLPETLGISGAEYLLTRLRRRRSPQTAVLALPDNQIAPGLAERTHAALLRFADHRIQQQQTTLRDIRRRGWRATVVALLLLAICLAMASLVGSDVAKGIPSLLRKTLEYGFEITGWVMLWHPIELLVFEPFLVRDKIAALRRLGELRLVVCSWKECGISIKPLELQKTG